MARIELLRAAHQILILAIQVFVVANLRSQAAILKLGATREGVFRSHMIRRDGTLRDSVYFSIIREEWPQVRERLSARLGAFAAIDEPVMAK